MILCSSAVGTSIHVRVHLILSPRQLGRSRFRDHSQHNRCRSRRRCSSRYCFCLCSNLGTRWTSRSCFGWRSGDRPWCCCSVPVVEAGLCVANHLAQGIHLGSRSSPASEVPTPPSPCGPWPPPPPPTRTGVMPKPHALYKDGYVIGFNRDTEMRGIAWSYSSRNWTDLSPLWPLK